MGAIVACVVAVFTPQGQICVKPDGSVEIPSGVKINDASREFWDQIAKIYLKTKDEKCL